MYGNTAAGAFMATGVITTMSGWSVTGLALLGASVLAAGGMSLWRLTRRRD